ncbi:hypothetical protein BURPS1710b_2552 [Burkholderia pseudomallei 1710b]|uniref:Uncharacterized protein n=1 Tax=Burkholderia pseudomallei (strain 1710b) TaxID=320372 RepID=Q3JR59_BURP1|nr:hypothetical protein BURPS1710b_2552 [Burkholderia pseudomallei 1710b]
MLHAKRAGDERLARRVAGPGLAERACKREQHGAARERNRRARVVHDAAARVDDERRRCAPGLDLIEPQRARLAACDEARGGRVENAKRALDFGRERGNARVARRALGAGEGRACGLRLDAPQRDTRDDQLVRGPQRGRVRGGIERGERARGFVDAADQQQAADREVSRMRGIDAVAVRLERRARRVERLLGPAELARRERDLGFGDDASRAGERFVRAERASRAAHERLCPDELAELRHRDAAQRERGRIVAQRDAVQRAERITRGERARRGRDQRVHRNPATLVTPTVRSPRLIYHHAITLPARRIAERSSGARRRLKGGTTDGDTPDRYARRMARRAARTARCGKGAHPARRRARAAARGVAVGARRQGVPIRYRRRRRVARGPVPRPLATARLPLHVRTRLRGGMPVVLGARGRLRRLRRPSRASRRHARGGVARAAREAAGVSHAHGMEVRVGVVARRRFQLRLQRVVYRSAAARRQRRIQLPARRPRDGCDARACARRRVRGRLRDRCAHVRARSAGNERVRARGRRRLSHVFDVRARAGRPLGHVPVARSRAERAQRNGRLVASP